MAVAAASVIAKVTRDALMTRLSRRHKHYNFAENKGYGTPEHWRALRVHGPSAVHRLSFAGVGQGSLFTEEMELAL
jgi:ribonuclease HII